MFLMVLEGTRSRLNARVNSARKLVQNEVAVLKGAFSDIKNRVDLSTSKPLSYTAGRGGILGKEGSLIKLPVVVVADTIDNVVRFTREQAEITRTILRR